MITWAAGCRLEFYFSDAFQTADFDFHFFGVHDVAALADRRDRLVGSVRSYREVTWHRVALAVASTSVCRQRELDAVRDGDFSGEADEMTANCWRKYLKYLKRLQIALSPLGCHGSWLAHGTTMSAVSVVKSKIHFACMFAVEVEEPPRFFYKNGKQNLQLNSTSWMPTEDWLPSILASTL